MININSVSEVLPVLLIAWLFQVPPGMQQGVGVGPGMVSPQQAMFMQQQSMGARGPFGQQGPGGVLQGPLAYLEKTTSNIGNYKF